MPAANPHTGGSVNHIRRNEACSVCLPQRKAIHTPSDHTSGVVASMSAKKG